MMKGWMKIDKIFRKNEEKEREKRKKKLYM